MFPNWRLKLREAKVAFHQGRLDDAGELLRQEKLDEFLQGKQLSVKVAAGMVERARTRVIAGETAAGWSDLAKAAQLGGNEPAIDGLRDELIARGIDEATDYLVAGDPRAAVARLARLEHRRPLSAPGRQLKEIAEHADQAKQLAERGHFVEATLQLDTAIAMAATGDTIKLKGTKLKEALEHRRNELVPYVDSIRELSDRLYESVEATRWQDVLGTAEAILAIAPKSTAAQGARRRAWREIGMDVTQIHTRRPGEKQGHVALQHNRDRASTRRGVSSAKSDTVTKHQRGEQLLLWVDAVGGYLVCLGDRIVLGQPSPHSEVDVPILADLSRHHAMIVRDGGSYILEAMHATKVDGRPVEGSVVLSDGQVITLGESVRMRFRKPHVLSTTARLDMETNHKTQPSADAIILLADSCVLGPKSHSHVPCRSWQEDVVLFRQSDQLICRASSPFQIDDIDVDEQGRIAAGSHVEGEEFSFTLEAVE